MMEDAWDQTHRTSLHWPDTLGVLNHPIPPRGQQTNIGELYSDLEHLPSDDNGNTLLPLLGGGHVRVADSGAFAGKEPFGLVGDGNSVIPLGNGLGQVDHGSMTSLLHSAGRTSINLDDVASLITEDPTNTTNPSEAAPASFGQPSFIRSPSLAEQAARQVVGRSGPSSYPLGPRDNFSVSDYGISDTNAGPGSCPWTISGATSSFDDRGQVGQLQLLASEQVSFAPPLGDNVPPQQSMAWLVPAGPSTTDGAALSEAAISDRPGEDLTHAPFPPSDSLVMGPLESPGDMDLIGVGDVFNTPPLPPLPYQTGLYGQTDNVATGPPIYQQPWPPSTWPGSQHEDTQTFVISIWGEQTPQNYDPGVISPGTTGETIPAPPLSATRPASAREESHPSWQTPSAAPHPIERDLQTSQPSPNQSTAMNAPPSGRLPAGSRGNQGAPKKRGRRKGKLSKENREAVQKKKDEKSVCIKCRYSHSKV